MPQTPAAPETWPCPCCRGLGDMADGAMAFTGLGFQATVVDYRPATPCRLCRGKRLVLVLPLPGEGATP